MSDLVDDAEDLKVIDALQTDPRVSPEAIAAVIGGNARSLRRRMNRMLSDGTVRVIATPAISLDHGVLFLRLRVLQGEVEAVAAALARREDIPYIDISVGGDQIAAVMAADPSTSRALVFRQLPATSAVVSVDAQPVIHVFCDSGSWRVGALTAAERAALTPGRDDDEKRPSDLDPLIVRELEAQPRASAAAIAQAIGAPASSVRRRLTEILRTRRVVLQTFVDPRRLGLGLDADLWMRIPPAHLARAGAALAAHPAVHGAFATAGTLNVHAAVWLRDTEDLYTFTTTVLADLGVEELETVVIGQSVKRPGQGRPTRRDPQSRPTG